MMPEKRSDVQSHDVQSYEPQKHQAMKDAPKTCAPPLHQGAIRGATCDSIHRLAHRAITCTQTSQFLHMEQQS